MLLEQLRDFEWLNEPEDVSFSEEGMSVTAKKNLISGKTPVKMFMPTTGIFLCSQMRQFYHGNQMAVSACLPFGAMWHYAAV